MRRRQRRQSAGGRFVVTTVPRANPPGGPSANGAADGVLDRLKVAAADPQFKTRAAEADRTGRLSMENVRLLQDIGLTGAVIEPQWGGAGAGLSTAVQAMETVAYSDASTAVAVNMHWIAARVVASLPPFGGRDEALAEVAANEALMCGAASVPIDALDSRTAGLRARFEGDDVVLDGRIGFGSMSDAARYALLGAAVESDDGGSPLVVVTLGRLGQDGLVNHGNWSAMGLRATASHDLECRGLRIPRSQCFIAPADLVREALTAQPLDRLNRTAQGALGILAIWLGLSQAAFDFTLDYVRNRYGWLASGPLSPVKEELRSEEAWAQSAIGEMDHWLGTGRWLLQDAVRRIEAGALDPETAARDLVRVVYHLRRMSEEVAMGAMKTCGAHAYVTHRSLERTFRDLVGGVVMAWKTDQLRQTLGMGALGHTITFAGPGGS
jgi:alkylation response protein AidB-like acyl-CoA dehydrogenase